MKHPSHLLCCVELFPLVAPMEKEIDGEDSDLESRANGDGDGPFMESRTAVVGEGGPFMNFGGSGP
uniref:Uncharacterized protein n=1 Tax=Oryza punctata TaxID=4537 RepID=A0A0E0LZL9_ORYPU